MLMSAQIRGSVDTLTASLGQRLKLVPTLHQCVNIFKPLLTMREKVDPWVPLPVAPGHGPWQVGGGTEPGPPSCPHKHKCE